MARKPKSQSSERAVIQDIECNSVLLVAKNEEQINLIKTISANLITFVKGSPGSGKTHIAVALALKELLRGNYSKVVVTRPVVATEDVGYLPGNLLEKINPYMMPIYDTFAKLLPEEQIKALMSKNGHDASIRVIPMAYMRGLSFENTFVVADETQNCTIPQMRMLLSRFGEGSKMIICGDVNQSDLNNQNGLADAYNLLEGLEDVAFVTLSENAIVRHRLVANIEKKYQDRQDTVRKYSR